MLIAHYHYKIVKVYLATVLCYDASPVISWKSKRQSSVALSMCEAEYMALL